MAKQLCYTKEILRIVFFLSRLSLKGASQTLKSNVLLLLDIVFSKFQSTAPTHRPVFKSVCLFDVKNDVRNLVPRAFFLLIDLRP